MAILSNYEFYRATGHGLLCVLWQPDNTAVICNIKLHITNYAAESASTSATGSCDDATTDFIVKVDSDTGPAYDVVLVTEDMSSAFDYVYLPEQPIVIARGDEVRFSLATEDQWGLEVVWRKEL